MYIYIMVLSFPLYAEDNIIMYLTKTKCYLKKSKRVLTKSNCEIKKSKRERKKSKRVLKSEASTFP